MSTDSDNEINVQIQWHSPDQAHFAVLMRDGVPWYLDGALTGSGETPGAAVDQLIGEAIHLVIFGENFLCAAPLSLADRIWLFKLLDTRIPFDKNEEMYSAIRQANDNRDPYSSVTHIEMIIGGEEDGAAPRDPSDH